MKYLWMDIETYSATPIKFGAHKYAEDCEVLLLAYAIDDGAAKVVDLSCRKQKLITWRDVPRELWTALTEVSLGQRKIVMHNGMNFDAVVLNKLFPAFGCGNDPELSVFGDPDNIVDTMVLAYEAGLPGSLDDLCTVFKLPQDQAKIKDGKRLIQIFCSPLPSNYKESRWTKVEKPEEWARFVEYCRRDVESMRTIFGKLPKWNLTKWERRAQKLDAEINRRGICIDTELAERAIDAWEAGKDDLSQRTQAATGGAVMAATQRDELIKYIKREYGIELDSMTKSEIEKRLNDDSCPEAVKDLLRLRVMSTRNSVAKYQSVLNWTNSDGRMRGTLQFRGASRTGRFSGRGPQFQNLARPSMKQDEIEDAIECVKARTVDLFYDDVGKVLSNCLRGLIIAPEGKKLVVADFSNIEGRVLAWLAGEKWKIQAFRDFDAGKGHDLYKMTYGRTFGVDPAKVTKAQRQMGKVLELALGYGGGAGAFASFARLYGVDLHGMAAEVRRTAPAAVYAGAEESYETYFLPKGLTEGMDKEVFVACDTVKRMWRDANPKIAKLWKDVGKAVNDALLSPEVSEVRGIIADRKANYLRLRLPSGRYLVYPDAKTEDDGGFSYMGVQQFTRKWTRIRSYGSKCVENLVQGIACDVLLESLLRMDAAGYKAVLTIHDEVITEVPDTSAFSYERMAEVMAQAPEWALDMPLAVDGYESKRYRKG